MCDKVLKYRIHNGKHFHRSFSSAKSDRQYRFSKGCKAGNLLALLLKENQTWAGIGASNFVFGATNGWEKNIQA